MFITVVWACCGVLVIIFILFWLVGGWLRTGTATRARNSSFQTTATQTAHKTQQQQQQHHILKRHNKFHIILRTSIVTDFY